MVKSRTLEDAHGASSVVCIPPHGLPGTLSVSASSQAVVLFAHGGGARQQSPRDLGIADGLNQDGMATLLFDLLHPHEVADRAGANLLDIDLLAVRLAQAIAWADQQSEIKGLPMGLLCGGTEAAAAIVAADLLHDRIGAIVVRSGRPDLAEASLKSVKSPTLLIVGGEDFDGVGLNEMALSRLSCLKTMEIIPGASRTFSEPDAAERVSLLSRRWFERHLKTVPV